MKNNKMMDRTNWICFWVLIILVLFGVAGMIYKAKLDREEAEIETTAEETTVAAETTTTGTANGRSLERQEYFAGDHDGDPEEAVTEAETEAPVYYEEPTYAEVYAEPSYTEAYEEPETEAYIEEVYEEPTEEETYAFESPDYDTGNPYGFSDNEIYEIARITMLENGHCSWECCYLTASVIINRYLDWGYSSIYDVIYDEGQYSTAYSGCDFITDQVWDAVSTAIATPDRNPHYQAMFPQGTVYRALPCGEYYCY